MARQEEKRQAKKCNGVMPTENATAVSPANLNFGRSRMTRVASRIGAVASIGLPLWPSNRFSLNVALDLGRS